MTATNKEPELRLRTVSIKGHIFYPKREIMKKLLSEKNSIYNSNRDRDYWIMYCLQLRAILENIVANDKVTNAPYIEQINELRNIKNRLAFSNENLEVENKLLKKQIDIVSVLKEIIIELKPTKDTNDLTKSGG